MGTYLLVSNLVRRLAHKLLDPLDAADLGVDVHEDLCALLEAAQHLLLDLRHLDALRELLELVELAVGLCEDRLLVLPLAEGEEGALLVAGREVPPRGLGLLGYEDIDAFLVLL